MQPQPIPPDPLLENYDPSEGVVEYNDCNGGPRPQYRFTLNPDAPPPPTPEELAERAMKEIAPPAPSPHIGPHRDRIAVKIPVWLWVDPAAPITITIAAGGIGLTATATLTSTTWHLGEAAAHVGGVGDYIAGPEAVTTCTGTGTPAPTTDDQAADPPCGYTFHWRSLNSRTHGTCQWPITVTATWTLDWRTTTGAAGQLTADTAPATDALRVGEIRTILIDANQPPPPDPATTCNG